MTDSAYQGCTFDPQRFASPDLAHEYSDAFQTYIELRLRGITRDMALIEAFEMIRFGIDLSNIKMLTLAIETNPYVRQKLDEALERSDVKEGLWSEKRAVHSLLKIIEDIHERGSTRLNAITQLNVLCGYVQLEESDANKVQQTVADFQRQHAAWVEAGTTTTH
jgi:hypothetical protein